MQPRIKFGLIAGGVGLVLNICVSALFGICGPVTAIVAGAVAGYLTIRAEPPPTQAGGAQQGAISGAIAGGLVLVGQLIGGIAALTVVQSIGGETLFGPVPTDPASQSIMWISGAGFSVCLGLVGLGLGAGAGAGAGYLGTSSYADASPQG